MSKSVELTIFDQKGRMVFSTHPLLYPNIKEFFRKTKLKLGDDLEQIESWATELQEGSIIINNNGVGEHKRWWQFDIKPLKQEKVMILVKEVSNFLIEQEQIKNAQIVMEKFLDNAPFAMICVDKNRHIYGLNQTLSTWLHQSKERIIGKNIEEIIDGCDESREEAVITVKPYRAPAFQALLFQPQAPESSISISNISILCKLDQINTLPIGNNEEHPTFVQSAIPALIIEGEGKILSYNLAFANLLDKIHLSEKNTIRIGGNIANLAQPLQRNKILENIKHACTIDTNISPFEFIFSNNKVHATAYLSLVRKEVNGEATFVLQFIDISEQKRLEQQFIQSQKMQAVGQLAGGIAHDFNNLLTAMIGFSDLLLQRYLPNDPSYMDVIQIKQNANRAANLVRQLLAFSRQQTLQPRIINITDSLAELSALLRRLIGVGIDLQVIHDRELCLVKVDVGQFEQVIINLAVNARDAMPNGGILLIRTKNYFCKRQQKIGHDVMPKGNYILIEVNDNGHGIALEHIDQIFEPFFSTKELGSGTGLGLSTVYGIVKQTEGFVTVESKLNHGTNFKIFLPCYEGKEAVATHIVESTNKDLTGFGTILLVEDEDAVRMFSARTLSEKGYTVIDVSSGQQALDLIQSGKKFDLMITDVVMPHMDGQTLSKKVKEICPGLKIIFISGYTEDVFNKNLDDEIYFLPKPFTLKDLAEKVKDVLNKN